MTQRLDRERQRPAHRDRAALIGCDPDAFEVFYREHVEAVQRFIARRVDNPETAADLTADVFLAAIQAAGSYDPARGTARAWLFGIARHRVADSFRAAARHSRAQAAVIGSELVHSDDLQRIHERLDAEAAARVLYARLRSIPDPERAVLELVALDDLSVAEAAAALGISTVAARVRLHRARRRLAADDAATVPAGALANSDLRITEGRA